MEMKTRHFYIRTYTADQNSCFEKAANLRSIFIGFERVGILLKLGHFSNNWRLQELVNF